jgi:hypothetical protein
MFAVRLYFLFEIRFHPLLLTVHSQESSHDEVLAVEDQVRNMELVENFRGSQESYLGRAANKLESDRSDHQELRRNLALQKECVKLAEKALSVLEEKTRKQEDEVRQQQRECTSVSGPIANVKAFARAIEVSDK